MELLLARMAKLPSSERAPIQTPYFTEVSIGCKALASFETKNPKKESTKSRRELYVLKGWARGRCGKMSEEEKWAEAYRVLFPGEEPVPSPYQGPLLMGSDHGFEKNDRTIEDLVDRAIEQTVTPEALTHIFGDVLKGMFETFRQRNHADNIRSEVSELVGVELEPPEQVDDQLESASPVLIQESVPELELLWLSNLVEQVPSQDLDFEFDDFMESLESGNKPDLTHGYGNTEAILGLPN
ncbi:hypothetical protein QQZ08_009788 [Neonectria magnoliae]|uniref:Uncharacterized protein n=1 Tax=Neonectria magnoliae TaxID=2732573 RepID=A0ABR1HKW6_9HYPO